MRHSQTIGLDLHDIVYHDGRLEIHWRAYYNYGWSIGAEKNVKDVAGARHIGIRGNINESQEEQTKCSQ